MFTGWHSFALLLFLAYVSNFASLAAGFLEFENCTVKPDPNRPENLPFNTSTDKKTHPEDRHFSLSSESPVAASLRQNSNDTVHVRRLFDLIRTLSNIIDTRNDNHDPRACNLRRDNWVSRSLDDVQEQQVGQFDNICETAIFTDELLEDDTVSNSTIRTLIEDAPQTIEKAGEVLFNAISRIEERPNPDNSLLNWTETPFQLAGWNIRQESQQCDVHTAFAYRVNGEWYVAAAMTNSDVDVFEEDYRRQKISEYIHEDLQFSLNVTHRSYCDPSILERSTTILSRVGRRQGLSMVYSMGYQNNPAISEAMEDNEILVDLAQDAVTVSNIAILALPMIMSLIPVAFLADLNTCATLWYIIFTDVFSSLPFLVKGTELIRTAQKTPPKFVAYQMGNETVGQIEMWSSQCSGEDSFRTLGIIFVVLAVCATIVGIVIELFADRYMQRKRQLEGDAVDGPFGHAIFNATTVSLLGGQGLGGRDSDSDSVTTGEDENAQGANAPDVPTGHAASSKPSPSSGRPFSSVVVSPTSRGSGDLI